MQGYDEPTNLCRILDERFGERDRPAGIWRVAVSAEPGHPLACFYQGRAVGQVEESVK